MPGVRPGTPSRPHFTHETIRAAGRYGTHHSWDRRWAAGLAVWMLEWLVWGAGLSPAYLGRPRGCLLASSGCLPLDGERARAPRGLLALLRVPLLSLVLGAEGCDWPWGPEVGPGVPEDEAPGAENTIQSGSAMLVSLFARSSAGGTVSPAPGGPRRRAAYLGDSWKGTEKRTVVRGRQVGWGNRGRWGP